MVGLTCLDYVWLFGVVSLLGLAVWLGYCRSAFSLVVWLTCLRCVAGYFYLRSGLWFAAVIVAMLAGLLVHAGCLF